MLRDDNKSMTRMIVIARMIVAELGEWSRDGGSTRHGNVVAPNVALAL